MLNLITDHLDVWASAELPVKTGGRGRAASSTKSPHGIQKLRALILKLAVRGKLVAQDTNDEPASDLLKRIQVEKAKLIAEGKIKKDKTLPPIAEGEKPYELPKGWEWVRFGNIAQHNSGKTLDSGRNAGNPIDYITTSNLYWGRFELESVRQMLIREDELAKCTATKNDLLICEGGEAGRAAVWDMDYDICFQNHIHRARFFQKINAYFAYRLFEKLNATGEINQYRQGVGISNMSGKALASVIFPLPPLAEQHRIVAKVDELMALCDQLEHEQTDNSNAHQTLVETLLATLTQAEGDGDFAAAWQRIAEHFDTLFTTEQSIDQLKQTLLQLAVMGKLVSQDPNDEPASTLLKRIQAEKAKLIAVGKIKKVNPLPPISDEEMPFDISQGWEWVRLGEITNFGTTEKLDFISDKTWVLDLEDIEKDTSNLIQKFRFSERKSLSSKNSFLAGDVLYGKLRPYLNKVIVADEDGVCTTEILPVRCYGPFSSHYFKLALKSPYFISYVNDRSYGMKMPRLGTEDGRKAPFPLPPLAEQQRIVAKVDELMAICDALKARLNEAQVTQVHLADAIVEQAVA
jgi:type I restriction enzyme S subunit